MDLPPPPNPLPGPGDMPPPAPLPPSPSLPTPPAVPAGVDPAASWTPPAAVADPARASRPHRSSLSAAWRWTLGLGWCVVMAGMGALAQSAFVVDADPFWLAVKPLPFAVPVAVLLAIVTDSRWTLPFSALGAAVLTTIAVVDLVGDNPTVGLFEAVCAAGAVLLTLGAWLGRERPVVAPVPSSAA